MAIVLPAEEEHERPQAIEEAARALREGGLIVYPTDTAYGIGCDISDRRSIDRLYQVKRRERKKPLSVLCGGLADISDYAVMNNLAFRLMKQALPGPYTFVLPASRSVPRALMPRRREVGVRVPDHPIPRAVAQALGRALVTSTVCLEGEEPLCDAWSIEAAFGNALAVILDGGPLPEGRLSTVVNLTSGEPTVTRHGAGEPFWE